MFILMEGAPDSIDSRALQADLEQLGDGVSVEEFNIWSLSRGKTRAAAKITCTGEPQVLLKKATQLCQDYGLDQVTLQVEVKGDTVADHKAQQEHHHDNGDEGHHH